MRRGQVGKGRLQDGVVPVQPGDRSGGAAVAVLVVGHEVHVIGRLADRRDVVRGGVHVDPCEVVRDHVDDELGAVRVQRGRQLLDEGGERCLVRPEHPLEIQVDAAIPVVADRGDHLVDEHVGGVGAVEQLIRRRGIRRVIGE